MYQEVAPQISSSRTATVLAVDGRVVTASTHQSGSLPLEVETVADTATFSATHSVAAASSSPSTAKPLPCIASKNSASSENSASYGTGSFGDANRRSVLTAWPPCSCPGPGLSSGNPRRTRNPRPHARTARPSNRRVARRAGTEGHCRTAQRGPNHVARAREPPTANSNVVAKRCPSLDGDLAMPRESDRASSRVACTVPAAVPRSLLPGAHPPRHGTPRRANVTIAVAPHKNCCPTIRPRSSPPPNSSSRSKESEVAVVAWEGGWADEPCYHHYHYHYHSDHDWRMCSTHFRWFGIRLTAKPGNDQTDPERYVVIMT